MIHTCANCGSDKVERKVWMALNVPRTITPCSDGESEDNWCPDCETNCEVNVKT